MSFGVGISDIIGALQFAKATCDSWRDAPARYNAIRGRLQSLQGPLYRFDHQLELFRRDATKRELAYWQEEAAIIFRPLEETLADLQDIVDRRSSLGTDKRRFWDRLRLGSRHINDLSGALDRHISDLTFLCTELALENDRKLSLGQDTIRKRQQEIQQGQNEILRLVSEMLPAKASMATVEAVAETVESVSMSSSFTEYEGDDPDVWREFRRQAIADGITSKELERYEPEILQVLQTVVQKRNGGRRRRRARSRSRGAEARPRLDTDSVPNGATFSRKDRYRLPEVGPATDPPLLPKYRVVYSVASAPTAYSPDRSRSTTSPRHGERTWRGEVGLHTA